MSKYNYSMRCSQDYDLVLDVLSDQVDAYTPQSTTEVITAKVAEGMVKRMQVRSIGETRKLCLTDYEAMILFYLVNPSLGAYNEYTRAILTPLLHDIHKSVILTQSKLLQS